MERHETDFVMKPVRERARTYARDLIRRAQNDLVEMDQKKRALLGATWEAVLALPSPERERALVLMASTQTQTAKVKDPATEH